MFHPFRFSSQQYVPTGASGPSVRLVVERVETRRIFIVALRLARFQRVIFQFKGASRLLFPWGLQPKANIYSAFSASNGASQLSLMPSALLVSGPEPFNEAFTNFITFQLVERSVVP